MLPGPCPPREPRRALRVSSLPRASPWGGWTLHQCASTSRNTLCVRPPLCSAVTRSVHSISWANGEVLPRRLAGCVRLAVLLPPPHGVTLVGGTCGGVIWTLSGAARALEVLHTGDHTLLEFPLPGPHHCQVHSLPFPPWLLHLVDLVSSLHSITFFSSLSPTLPITPPHIWGLPSLSFLHFSLHAYMPSLLSTFSRPSSVPVPALVGVRYRLRGAPHLGSRWGSPGWLMGPRRCTVTIQSLSEYSHTVTLGARLPRSPITNVSCPIALCNYPNIFPDTTRARS